jgi:8-oxo-dGTP pyrophosphatase MutT (NUDIX family)
MTDLDVAGLRRRLGRPLPATAVYGDDDTGREESATVAAVLVPIIVHPGGLTVLFTQRTAHLKAHSGQVSFPGGRAEPGDASPEETALRETEEEVGLARGRVEVLARLPEYFTRTGFRVTPVIGLVQPPLELAPDPGEVESVFEVPLAFLLDTRNHQRHTREFKGVTVGYYAMPYRTNEGDRLIWGATAGMVVNLCRALAD